MTRTKAILAALARGGEDNVAQKVQRVFGASSIAECLATYDAVGKAERTGLEQMVERIAKDASAVFWFKVEREMEGQA